MKNEQVIQLPLNRLTEFQEHLFKVRDDEFMDQLTDSIRSLGALTPIVVRPEGNVYTTEVFRMFSTDEAVEVTLLCDNCCMKSVVDKFGMKIRTRSVGEEQFRTTVKVCAGPTFYCWVFGAGGKIVIESPIETRNEYREMLQNALNQL